MKSDTKQIIEIVGIFGVIASLFFVGMQLMLDRRVAMSEQYFNRAESEKSDLRALLESEAYFSQQEENWERGERPAWWDESSELASLIRDGTMTPSSLYVDILQSRIDLIGYDSIYYQYTQGLIPSEYWEVQETVIENQMRRDIIRKNQYRQNRRPINEVVSRILSEIESEIKF